MITNELRKADGLYKENMLKLYFEIAEEIKELYNNYHNRVSYDGLHSMICDSSYAERVTRIAIDVAS